MARVWGPSIVVAGRQRMVAGTGRAAGALQRGAAQSPGALGGGWVGGLGAPTTSHLFTNGRLGEGWGCGARTGPTEPFCAGPRLLERTEGGGNPALSGPRDGAQG